MRWVLPAILLLALAAVPAQAGHEDCGPFTTTVDVVVVFVRTLPAEGCAGLEVASREVGCLGVGVHEDVGPATVVADEDEEVYCRLAAVWVHGL